MATTAPNAAAGNTAGQSLSIAPAQPRQLAARWRVLITLALLLHLTAVIAAPWSGPEPGGPLSEMVVHPFRQYLDATYCGHGYRFFAPAPGPSHLVQYTLTMPDGDIKTGRFPDKQTEWPRLFYHRHFMLTDKLGNILGPEPPPDAPPEIHREW